MAVNLSPVGGVAAQFFDNSGNVLTGGKLYTYLAGTTTPAVTYTTNAGNVPWSNPIILDAAGRVSGSGEIWLSDGIQYKFILRDSNDVLIATYDNINGINSNFVNFTNSQEIQTATAGQTVFNLATLQYQPGTNSLSVFVDGVNQYGPGAQYAYLETDADTVTFVNGLHVGAQVKFTTSQINSTTATDAEQVSYTPPFTSSVPTNVEAKLAQYVSVKDFGAVGNGIADDTTAFQNFLNAAAGKTGFVNPGTYLISSTLRIKSNTILSMYDATLQASNSLTTTSVILLNDKFDGTDTNIEIHGGSFIGNTDTSRQNALLAFLRVDKLKIKDVYLSTNTYQLLAIGGCTNFVLENIEAEDYGRPAVTTEGGSAFWIGHYSNVPCSNGVLNNLYAHDGEWAGMYLAGTATAYLYDICVNNFRAVNVKEAGIFFVYAYDCEINNVFIKDITRKNISSSGIETGETFQFNITGGIIKNTDAAAISLSNCQAASIGGGLQTINAKRDGTYYPTCGHITFIFNTLQRGITIANVKSYDQTVNNIGGYSDSAVQIGTTATPAQFCIIKDNDFSGTAWASGDAIEIIAGSTAFDTYHYNNAGSADALPYVVNVAMSSSTGAQAITGVPFRPRHIEFTATYINGTTLYQSTTSIYYGSGGVTHNIARDGSGQRGGSSTGSKAVLIANSSGAVLAEATLTSFDEFGFTINVVTSTIQPEIRAVCYA